MPSTDAPRPLAVDAALRDAIAQALQNEDAARLDALLSPLRAFPDATRTSQENLLFHRSEARRHVLLGDDRAATRAFLSAYTVDSRDLVVLEALAARLFDDRLDLEPPGQLLVIQRLMIFHRHALDATTLGRVYRLFGESAQTRGDARRAERCFEKALEVVPGDVGVIRCFLSVMKTSEDPDEARAVRERLIDSIPHAEGRAEVLVLIGDDQRQGGDDAAALATYERALDEHPQSRDALTRVQVLSELSGDWRRAAEALASLARLEGDPAERTEGLEEAASIYAENDDLRAANRLYNEVLDANPLRPEAFSAIRKLLLHAEDWPALERNFTRMAQRLEDLDDPRALQLLPSIYQPLAELRLDRLGRDLDAAKVFERLIALEPQEPAHILKLADIYLQHDDRLPAAQQAYTILLNAERDDAARLPLIAKLANVYERRRDYDRAFCMMRVLDVYDQADERSSKFVQRVLQQRPWPPLSTPLDDDAWRALHVDQLDPIPGRLFALGFHALLECYSDDLLETYDLRPKKDRFNLSQKTLLSSTYLPLSPLLGHASPPPIYAHDKEQWLRNAYVSPPSALLGSNLLTGHARPELAFICARTLTLLRPEFYLIGRGDPRGLSAILRTFIQIFRPDVGGAISDRGQQRIAKAIKRLDDAAQREMASIIDALLDAGANIDMPRWVAAAEHTANRVAFLFCDDLQVAAKAITKEAAAFNRDDASTADQITHLISWSTSASYMDLRERLGLAFKR